MSAVHILARKVNFASGSSVVDPVSLHATEKEAREALRLEQIKVQRKFVNGGNELLGLLGIAGIEFITGTFETPHEDLVKVPRIIMPTH